MTHLSLGFAPLLKKAKNNTMLSEHKFGKFVKIF